MLAKLKQALKRNRKLYLKISPVFGLYRNAVMTCARLRHGVDKNLAVFSAFDSRSYNDNPRYISEALHELRPDAKIVWLFKDVEKTKVIQYNNEERPDKPTKETIHEEEKVIEIKDEPVSTVTDADVIVDTEKEKTNKK